MVSSHDVTEVFVILTNNMSGHKNMPEHLDSFERTYIRDRRRPWRSERYGSAIFPEERWNHFETASEGIARATNSIEGFHLRNTGTFSMSSPNIMDFYDRAWKRYADATNTILTNYPVIKCQWLLDWPIRLSGWTAF